MTAPSVEQPLSRRATIADVAERAGVSRSAVSKVLRNAYGISDAMRASVEQAMAALHYRPQIAARGLRGRTYTLGVVMPDMRNPFFPDILDGIWSALQNTAYQPLLAVRHSEHKTEQAMIEMMLDRKLDGFVMIAPIIGHDYLWRLAATVPIVMIGRHETGGAFDSVNNDDERGAYLAVEHLIQQGHKRIAFFSFEAPEDSAVNPVVYRQRGYIAAMQAHGLDRYLQISKRYFRAGRPATGPHGADGGNPPDGHICLARRGGHQCAGRGRRAGPAGAAGAGRGGLRQLSRQRLAPDPTEFGRPGCARHGLGRCRTVN